MDEFLGEEVNKATTPNSSMSVIAFHEKAGCQVGSCVFVCHFFFCRCRVATVATLPSALFVSDLIARCKLGVLVSAGAATCLSTSLSISRWKLGQAIIAVTETRHLGFVLPIYFAELCCCRQ